MFRVFTYSLAGLVVLTVAWAFFFNPKHPTIANTVAHEESNLMSENTLLFRQMANNPALALPIERFMVTDMPVWLLRRSELPIRDLKVIFSAGSSRDEAAFGIAEFTNHLLDFGTKKIAMEDFHQALETEGAILRTAIDRDKASITLRVPDKKAFDAVFPLYQEVLHSPAFHEKDIQREKENHLLQIESMKKDPGASARDSFIAAMYGDHPYGHPVIGTAETVTHFNKKQIEAFFRRYYHRHNATLVMVGDWTLEEAKQAAESIYQALSEGGVKPEPLAQVGEPLTQNITIDFPSAQSHIYWGKPFIARNDPQLPILSLANYILGGSPLGSYLFEVVRNQGGFAYSVGSYMSPFVGAGPLVFYMQTRQDQANQAVSALQEAAHDFLSKPIDAETFEKAKTAYIGGLLVDLDGNGALLSYLSELAYHQLPTDQLLRTVEKLSQLSLADFNRTVTDRLRLENMTLVVLGG